MRFYQKLWSETGKLQKAFHVGQSLPLRGFLITTQEQQTPLETKCTTSHVVGALYEVL